MVLYALDSVCWNTEILIVFAPLFLQLHWQSASKTLHLGTTDLPSVLDLTINLIERDHICKRMDVSCLQ